MRKVLKNITAVLLAVTCVSLTACGGEEAGMQTTTDKSETSNNSTEGTTEKATSEEQTTDNVVEKLIDGFYNCVYTEEPCIRFDFEVKETVNGYKAVFYSQYSEFDKYGTGSVLNGEKLSDDTYKFVNADEEYTVVWDGENKLRIDGTYFTGDYERGIKESYDEDYMIPDIPQYEADKNVEEGIEIDSTLAYYVRQAFNYDSEQVLTYEDLESVTYIMSDYDNPVTSLKGVSLLTGLEELHINSGYVADISELADLENLRMLTITNCYIKEIPDLSGCSNLESLYLSGNMIDDVAPIADVPTLKYVDLNSNLITSIEPLKEVTFLELLCIESNCIIDYETIKDNASLISAYNQGAQGTYEEALALENTAKDIVGEFPEVPSDLEKEIIIYKYIKENMYFDDSLRPTKSFGYYGITEGRGVCGDYAEAFALLARHAGLEAYVCGSDTHAWNIVNIDGVYYHCDALWDEDVPEWTHFNRSTGYIYNLPDHMHDLRKYPICDESMSVLDYCYGFMEE